MPQKPENHANINFEENSRKDKHTRKGRGSNSVAFGYLDMQYRNGRRANAIYASMLQDRDWEGSRGTLIGDWRSDVRLGLR